MTFLVDLPDLKASGLARDAGHASAITVVFNRPLTDDELRWLHDHLRHGIIHNFTGSGCRYCDFDPRKEYTAQETVPAPEESIVKAFEQSPRRVQETPAARICPKCEGPIPDHWQFQICNACPQG